MKAILFLFFTLIISGNLSAQSAHGIGIDLIHITDDQYNINIGSGFQLGLRYEHRIQGKHGAKFTIGYSGASGSVFGIGYQYYFIDNHKFKIVTGLDYKYTPRNSEVFIDGNGNLLSIPIEARFLLYKNIWINAGISPSWEIGSTRGKRYGLRDARIGAIIKF